MRNVIVFDSIHYTIKADKLLQNKGLKYQIITTPREISAECGMSIETNEEYIEEICKILKENNLNMDLHVMVDES